MKKNDFAQIKGMDTKELLLKVNSLRDEIVGLVWDKNMKKLKDLKTISKKRKDLAQVLTVMRQKELLMDLESKVMKKKGGKPERDPSSTASPQDDKQI